MRLSRLSTAVDAEARMLKIGNGGIRPGAGINHAAHCAAAAATRKLMWMLRQHHQLLRPRSTTWAWLPARPVPFRPQTEGVRCFPVSANPARSKAARALVRDDQDLEENTELQETLQTSASLDSTDTLHVHRSHDSPIYDISATRTLTGQPNSLPDNLVRGQQAAYGRRREQNSTTSREGENEGSKRAYGLPEALISESSRNTGLPQHLSNVQTLESSQEATLEYEDMIIQAQQEEASLPESLQDFDWVHYVKARKYSRRSYRAIGPLSYEGSPLVKRSSVVPSMVDALAWAFGPYALGRPIKRYSWHDVTVEWSGSESGQPTSIGVDLATRQHFKAFRLTFNHDEYTHQKTAAIEHDNWNLVTGDAIGDYYDEGFDDAPAYEQSLDSEADELTAHDFALERLEDIDTIAEACGNHQEHDVLPAPLHKPTPLPPKRIKPTRGGYARVRFLSRGSTGDPGANLIWTSYSGSRAAKTTPATQQLRSICTASHGAWRRAGFHLAHDVYGTPSRPLRHVSGAAIARYRMYSDKKRAEPATRTEWSPSLDSMDLAWADLEADARIIAPDSNEQGRAILVLENASAYLTEEDFRRLLPRGKHLQNWHDNFMVLHDRDEHTFRSRRRFFLIFESLVDAKIYLRQAQRMQLIARQQHEPSADVDPHIQLPPSSFELCATSTPLQLSVMKGTPKPDTILARLVEDPEAVREELERRRRSVLFSIEGWSTTTSVVRQLLSADGWQRRLHWSAYVDSRNIVALPTASRPSSQTITTASPSTDVSSDENKETASAESKPPPGQASRKPSKDEDVLNSWMLTFDDAIEARRFVRAWHRRPWPQDNRRLERVARNAQAIISAEYLG